MALREKHEIGVPDTAAAMGADIACACSHVN